VTVIHSIASAQSRVTTLHLIIHELLVFLVVSVAIEVPASVRGGGARNWVGGHVQIGRRTGLTKTLFLFHNSQKSRKCQQPSRPRLLTCMNLQAYRADLRGLFIMAAGT
jgi:hypothetical protein